MPDSDNNKSATITEDLHIKPIVAPCRKIPVSTPFSWLRKGWEDLKKVPLISLSYGFIMMLISVLITYVAYKAHSIVLAIALTAGFFFLGPIIAIGLYSLSRQISNNIPPQFLRCLKEGKKNLGNEMVLSFMFLIIFLIWARAASMLHIFFPSSMKTEDWIMFLSVGSLVGAIFATIIFIVGVFSIPMLMDRKVDTVTAVITSINAVLKNKVTMMIWGVMIVVIVLIGIATFYVGFIFLLPIVGHATWHAYIDTIDSDAWELAPGLGESESGEN